MSNLYKRIDALCSMHNVSITTMCKASGASRASLSDLKVGRKQNLSTETLSKIDAYFSVSVDYLLGKEIEKAPTVSGERDILDEVDIGFYQGFKELTEEQKETVRDMVQLMRARRAEKEK